MNSKPKWKLKINSLNLRKLSIAVKIPLVELLILINWRLFNRSIWNSRDNKIGSKLITMRIIINHLMRIEVSLLMMLEMRMHQRKSAKEKKDAKERDQIKRMNKRPSQKSKKNSLISLRSKTTSHSLKMILTRRARRKRKKPRQRMNEVELVINLINFTFKCY